MFYDLKVHTLVIHMVSDMFTISARYFARSDDGHDFYMDENLTVEEFNRKYSNWDVVYFTIENGVMVVGINEPT